MGQLFTIIEKEFQKLAKYKNPILEKFTAEVLGHFSSLEKYVICLESISKKKTTELEDLEKKYNSAKEALRKVVLDNSKLKEETLLMAAKLQEKEFEVEKFKVLNKLNVSYASSRSFR